jgi:hypothetical protein
LQLPQMQILIVLSFAFVFFWFHSSKDQSRHTKWVTPFIPAEWKFVDYFFCTKFSSTRLTHTHTHTHIYVYYVCVCVFSRCQSLDLVSWNLWKNIDQLNCGFFLYLCCWVSYSE